MNFDRFSTERGRGYPEEREPNHWEDDFGDFVDMWTSRKEALKELNEMDEQEAAQLGEC